MNFIKRLVLYCKNSGSFSGLFTFILFAIIRNHPLTNKKRFTRIIHSLIPSIKLSPKNFKGNSILLDTGNFSHFIIVDEFIIAKIYDITKVKFKPDVIYDCGAHIGLFSILVNSHFPDTPIFSFEPIPENYNMIEKNIAVNNIHKICVEKAAVSIREGSSSFFVADSSFGGSLKKEVLLERNQDNSVKVKLIDFANYLDGHQADKILLKMDIEGEEENLIPYIVKKLPKTCAIFFETHSLTGKQEIYDCLNGHGFSVQEIRNVGKYSDHFASR